MDEQENGWNDPIVAAIHSRRKALVEGCNNDPQAVFEYFLQKQNEGEILGLHYITRPSKPSEHPRTGTNN